MTKRYLVVYLDTYVSPSEGIKIGPSKNWVILKGKDVSDVTLQILNSALKNHVIEIVAIGELVWLR